MEISKADEKEYGKIPEDVSDEKREEIEKEISDRLNALALSIRDKYRIPEGVHLFQYDEGVWSMEEKTHLTPWIKAWVAGMLTDDQFVDLHFYFEECKECDWGWVLINEPLGYYDCISNWKSHKDALRELHRIGTRSKKKAKLRNIINWCIAPDVENQGIIIRPEGFRVREFPQAFHDYRKDEMVASKDPRPSKVKGEVTLGAGLSPEEKLDLKKLEKVVQKGANTFLEVGRALHQIKTQKLYREEFPTFQAYCEDRLGFSRVHAYRLVDAWQTKAELDIVTTELNLEPISTERQLRAMKSLVKAGKHRELLEELAANVVEADFVDGNVVEADVVDGNKAEKPALIKLLPSELMAGIKKRASASNGSNGDATTRKKTEVGEADQVVAFRAEIAKAIHLLRQSDRDGALKILEALIKDDDEYPF